MVAESIKDALNAIRANFKAALLLWIMAAAVLLLYFNVNSVKLWMNNLSLIKIQYGYLFSFVSTSFFGAVVPAMLKVVTGMAKANGSVKKVFFFMLMWGLKGIEVDLLYRFQALLFGTDNAIPTLMKKLFVDQMIYVTVWALPSIVALLLLAECNFNVNMWFAELKNRFYYRKVLPVLFPNWLIWAPSAFMIYMLPPSLQIPMQNMVLCFWVIIFSFLVKRTN